MTAAAQPGGTPPFEGSWSAPAFLPPGAAPYGYGQPYGHPYGMPRPTSTNGLAIAGMVLGIVWFYWIGSLLAVVFGHVALSQIKRNPYQNGKGMAIAGLVLGYIGLAVLLLIVLLVVVAAAGSDPVGGPATPV